MSTDACKDLASVSDIWNCLTGGGSQADKFLIVDGQRVVLTTQSAFEAVMRQNGASDIECDGMITAEVRHLKAGANAPRSGSPCSWVYKRKPAKEEK